MVDDAWCAATSPAPPTLEVLWAGRGSNIRTGGDVIGRAAIGLGTGGIDVVAKAIGDTIDDRGASAPRKSFTRVSTSWLIEMLLVSQNAFSRS